MMTCTKKICTNTTGQYWLYANSEAFVTAIVRWAWGGRLSRFVGAPQLCGAETFTARAYPPNSLDVEGQP
jgi:hypothetical protein